MQAFSNQSATDAAARCCRSPTRSGPRCRPRGRCSSDTTPVIENQLRPFSVAVQPRRQGCSRPPAPSWPRPRRTLVAVASTCSTRCSTRSPTSRTGQKGYLFWGSWLAHIADSLTSAPGRPGPDRARHVHGDLRGAEPVRGRRSQNAAARRSGRCSTCSTRPTGARSTSPVLPDGEHRREQAGSQRREDPDDGRVRGLVHRPAAVPVDLVRRHGAVRRAGLSHEGGVHRTPSSSACSPTCGSPGVSVGKVVAVALDRHTGLTKAVIQIDPQVRAETGGHAGDPAGRSRCSARPTSSSRRAPTRRPSCPTEGPSRRARCRRAVNLDQILSTFDPATRKAFQVWSSSTASRSPTAARTSTGDRRAVPVRHQRRLGAGRAQPRQRRDEHAAAKRRPGVLGAEPLARSAPGLHQATPTPCSRRPRRRTRRWPTRSGPSRRSTSPPQQTIDRVDRFAQTTKPLIDELRPAARPAEPGAASRPRSSPPSCAT